MQIDVNVQTFWIPSSFAAICCNIQTSEAPSYSCFAVAVRSNPTLTDTILVPIGMFFTTRWYTARYRSRQASAPAKLRKATRIRFCLLSTNRASRRKKTKKVRTITKNTAKARAGRLNWPNAGKA